MILQRPSASKERQALERGHRGTITVASFASDSTGVVTPYCELGSIVPGSGYL
jgi:hypothetical protein